MPVKIVVRDALQTPPISAEGGARLVAQEPRRPLVKKPNGEVAIDPEWEEGILDISTGDKRNRILEI